MPNFFPPPPSYPRALDSDYTLFMVYNTTETRLSADNEPWSDEIDIVPVEPTAAEIWPSNGFATIEGELLYYDAVDTNIYGKVVRFRRCARNLGGKASRLNKSGTWIRAFVVAEHHNQLADAIAKVEDFIGINFDTRVGTLDYRIRNLNATPVIFDDWGCVDVNFTFEELKNNPASGIVCQYNVQITGTYTSYQLDFGDGTSTTSDLSGTHTYAYNATVDPVLTVTNQQCSIVQSPIQRTATSQPSPAAAPAPFSVTIPEIQDIPTFSAAPIALTPGGIDLPPIVLPCLDLSQIPNISIGPIYVGPINVPSLVSITPIDIPSMITISPITIPSFISISPIPSHISIGPAPNIAPIGFAPTPSIAPIDVNIDINIDTGNLPSCISLGCDSTSIAVDWGSPPTLNVAFVSSLNAQSARKRPNLDPELAKELGADYLSLFDDEGDSTLQVEYEAVGIPNEIRILPPEFSDIKVTHDLPTEIKFSHDLHQEIRLVGGENIPTQITVLHDLPSEIRLVGIDVPSVIRVEHNIPEVISIKAIDPIPSTILLDASQIPDTIQVVGVPSTIELKAPEFIRLVLDENVEVPLVYRQGPIDVKVELDMKKVVGTDDNGGQCFMFVPCTR